jgi:uncharacterized integral membrane protein
VFVKFGAVLALLAAILVLAVQNPSPVLINFLHWRAVSAPVLVIALAGVIVGFVGGFFLAWRPRAEASDEERPEDEPPA